MEENSNEFLNNDNDIGSSTPEKPAEPANENQGYTVTPEGGFYNRRSGDIIQDPPVQQSASQNYSGGTNYTAQDTTAQNSAQSTTGNTSQTNYGTTYNSGYTPYHAPTPTPQNFNNSPKKEKKRYGAGIVFVASFMAAVIGAIGGVTATMLTADKEETPTQIVSSESGGSNVNITVDKTTESVVEAVAEKAIGSVVGIRTTTSVNNFFYGNSESTGEGSGVIYSSDGYIITNYHVIQSVVEATSNAKIEVFIGNSDTTSHEATVVGYSISTDLAVLKINVSGLTPVEVGSSDELKVGQFVVTIGSPGGLDFRGSVTYGVISGLDRVVSGDENVKLIQTDAAINPGNSGGALLDTNGRLIGINSSKIVSTEYEGMGFAIPISTVLEKCNKIISKQNEPEPYIGISLSMKYTEDVLSYYGFPNGAVVLSVDEGGPAEASGIRRGDIITEFGGKAVESAALLEEMIAECEPGKSVKVKLYRSGRYYSTDIEIISNNTQ